MSGAIWLTADTHFRHKAMTAEDPKGRDWRGFPTMDEHDAYLVEQWNKHVRGGDTVWHLGDVLMGGADVVETMGRLNGTKHLIAGNHDRVWPGHRDFYKHQRYWLEAFETISAFARRRIGDQQVMLSHMPYDGDHTSDERFAQYRLRDEGLYLLHGHVHDAWATRGRQINVGVDVRDFRPINIDEIPELMKEQS